MLAAVVGGMVSAPFAMVLFAAFVTQVGPLNTAPILVAVITSYLSVEAVKYLMATRQHDPSAPPTPSNPPSAASEQ